MKKHEARITDMRGSGDLSALKAAAEAIYALAADNESLRVLHPTTGQVISGAEYKTEIETRHALNLKGSEFWQALPDLLGQTALRAAEPTVNHQEILTPEDRLNAMQSLFPNDRHLARVDAA